VLTLRWGFTTSIFISISIWVKSIFLWSFIGWSTNNSHIFAYKKGYQFLEINKCFLNYNWSTELAIVFSKTIQGHGH
jgi:hypothetical protein